MTLMFQREVGLRIVAEADDDHYGRLGVLCGWRTMRAWPSTYRRRPSRHRRRSLPPWFTWTPIENPIPCAAADLEKVTMAAFGQRRKMLRQSVKSIGGEALLAKAEIDPKRREKSVEDSAGWPVFDGISLFSPAGRSAERMRGDEGAAATERAAPSSGPTGHLLPAGEKRRSRHDIRNHLCPAADRAPCQSTIEQHVAPMLDLGAFASRVAITSSVSSARRSRGVPIEIADMHIRPIP
jgi:hypothetical protein